MAQNLPWNFVYLEYQCDNCMRSLMITINKLDSHQSSTHGIVNYSFVSMGENPTVRLFFYLSFLYFADIFIQAHYSVKKQKMRPSPLKLYYVKKYENIF